MVRTSKHTPTTATFRPWAHSPFPITFMDKYNPDQFDIVGCSESEGRGFSNGLWDPESGIAQSTVDGHKVYKRLFIRRHA